MQPPLARLLLLLALVAVAATAAVTAEPVAASTTARSLTQSATLESAILVELNAVRRAHGLRPLRASKPLAAAAVAHSRAMALHGFFRHHSRDGSVFWKRVQRYYGPRGYASWSVGENLLWSTTGLDAKRALELWMESPGHRKNILTPRWREVGLAAVVAPAAPGVFGGRDVVIVTTDFGVRS